MRKLQILPQWIFSNFGIAKTFYKVTKTGNINTIPRVCETPDFHIFSSLYAVAQERSAIRFLHKVKSLPICD